MSDSDTSGGDLGLPETPESPETDGSIELELIECDRRENECRNKIANLERQYAILQEQLFNERMEQVKYNLSDVQGGKSQAYLGPLQRLQNAAKAGKEEIILYQDVGEYYSKVENKLPLLLIGPPGIRLQDVRQRLMEDSSQFATAVPHTTRSCHDYEEAGQDYHFISQEQFDLDKLNRKFMEYGQFANHYYGTSLEAIREVVNSDKICLLKVRHQTVQILRVKNLKPLTVFVAFLEPEEHEIEE